MMRRTVTLVALAFTASSCSMLPVVRAMLGTRKPNHMISGQLFANGGGANASLGADGVAHVTIERRPREVILHPALVLMAHPGDLEITFSNNDPQAHLLLAAQSDGAQQVLDLAPLQAGTTRVHYGTPGIYTIADAMANEMGQGMQVFVIVEGEVPPSAKIDRPRQRRP